MGTTLTGTTPQDTYDSLIKVTDNGPLSGTAKYLSDGLGNDSALALSTSLVGIGTATPDAKLTTLVADNAFAAKFKAANGVFRILPFETGLGVKVSAVNGSEAAFASLVSQGSDHQFVVGTSEAMRITSAGNVGIGTSSPVSKLNVNGVITASAGAQSNPTGGASIVVDYQTTSDLQGRVRSRDWDGGIWKNLRFEGENIIVSPSGTEVGRFTANGLTFNGDTAAANALDDYEEGNFTPAIVGTTTAGTANYYQQWGRYTKIGRVVNFQLYIAYDSGTGTGSLRIAGLPFASSTTNLNPACTIGYFDVFSLTANNVATSWIINGETNIGLFQYPIGGGTTTLVDYDGAANISISGTYIV
jgi:hypothetical protein